MRTESVRNEASGGEQDAVLCQRICAGETALFAELMRRNNHRLYRAIRSILREETEVEEVMQDAWVSVFQHLGSFQGRSRFSTWLLRIGVHAALAHRRRTQRFVDDEETVSIAPGANPERGAASRQLLGRVEQAVDRLPAIYRVVLVLRQIEGLDTAETAALLGIEVDAVKTRLRRARLLLREALPGDLLAAFPFEAPRCDRLARAVFERIAG
jgi:RNA polymerase sigma-70 factor (ECF subfamily)